MVIIIPRLSRLANLCSYYLDYPYSLLGLGDMLIPGLSVNYGILFDTASKCRYKIYFIANIFGKSTFELIKRVGKIFFQTNNFFISSQAYGIGLFLAFIGLIFMKTAQPALFYLCPTHLIVTFALALFRKELGNLWTGEPVRKQKILLCILRLRVHNHV